MGDNKNLEELVTEVFSGLFQLPPMPTRAPPIIPNDLPSDGEPPDGESAVDLLGGAVDLFNALGDDLAVTFADVEKTLDAIKRDAERLASSVPGLVEDATSEISAQVEIALQAAQQAILPGLSTEVGEMTSGFIRQNALQVDTATRLCAAIAANPGAVADIAAFANAIGRGENGDALTSRARGLVSHALEPDPATLTAPSVDAATRLGVAVDNKRRVHVCVTGAKGQVGHVVRSASKSHSSPWTGWTLHDVHFTSAPVLSPDSSGGVLVVGRDRAAGLSAFRVDEAGDISAVRHHPGVISGPIGAARGADGRLVVVAADISGRLWRTKQRSITEPFWTDWVEMDSLDTRPDGRASMASNLSPDPAFAIRVAGGGCRARTAGRLSAGVEFLGGPGTITSDVAAIADGSNKLHLFAANSHRRLSFLTRTPGQSEVAGGMRGGPIFSQWRVVDERVLKSSPTASRLQNGKVGVFALGELNTPLMWKLDADGTMSLKAPEAVVLGGPPLASVPVGVVNEWDRVELYATRMDGVPVWSTEADDDRFGEWKEMIAPPNVSADEQAAN